MKRLLPLSAGIAALVAVAVVAAVAVGASSEGADKGGRENDDSGGAPVAAVCAPDVPDCDDMIVVGEDEPMNMCIAPDEADPGADPVAIPECNDAIDGSSRCAADAAPDCQAVDQPPITSIDGIDPNECNAVHNIDACSPEEIARLTGMASTSYDLTIAFDASVTQTDIDETVKVITSISPDTEFVVRESFPPVGAARLTTDMASFCPDLEAKLESASYVDDVTCLASRASTNPSDPDEPVSSEPASAE
jgi:hypothetical protein